MINLINFAFKKAKFLIVILLAFTFVSCEGTASSKHTTNIPNTIDITMSKNEILEQALTIIDIPSNIDENIELPVSLDVNGHLVNATWHSTASKVIDNTGKITPNVADKNAVLTVTLEYEGETLNKSYDIIVNGNEAFLVIYAVFNSLIEMPTEPIIDNLTLPTEYNLDGKIVEASWVSSDSTSLTNTGIVTLKDYPMFINLTLELTYMGITQSKTYSFFVAQDPDTLPVNLLHLSPIYTGTIEDESPKPGTPSCFPGAIYRKVVSSKDYWLGIEGTITLPEFIPDEERYDVTRPTYYLDNSSIYMGGHAYYESDVGLSWMIGHTDGTSAQISESGVAFRPFWRYITTQEDCANNNCWKNANVSDHEFYYYPGDKVQMSVFSPRPGYMQMRIELISLTTNQKYINKRTEYGLEEDFNRIFVTPEFSSPGIGELKSEFKRVNAIDQSANEGKPTLNTNAKVVDAIWHEVYLYREINGITYKVPMTEERTASMMCPIGTNVNGDFSDTFTINYDGVDKLLGGEIVNINPNNGDGTLYNLTYFLEKKEEYI
ncbi:MAG: hypothetical protein WC152_06370 [Candidatus Izemoplasmatales bacterium]